MEEDHSVYSSDEGTIDMHIVDHGSSEEEFVLSNIPTQNRFERHNGQRGGRGDGWQQPRRSKRKKVSSGSIDINMNSFGSLSSDDKLSRLFDVVSRNNEVLTDLKKEQNQFCQVTRELQENVARLNERVSLSEKLTEQQDRCIRILAYHSIDLEARSRRNNIIIWGVTERSSVHTELLVLNFLDEMLDIDEDSVVIDRAHRLGRAESGRSVQDPKRPIIVRFRDYKDTELVMRRAYKLKGTPFGIDRDYPREIAAARRELYNSQEAREARQNRQRVQIRYPAKLYIDDRLKSDKFPEWQGLLIQDRVCSIGLLLREAGIVDRGHAGHQDSDGIEHGASSIGHGHRKGAGLDDGASSQDDSVFDRPLNNKQTVVNDRHAPSEQSVNTGSRDLSYSDAAGSKQKSNGSKDKNGSLPAKANSVRGHAGNGKKSRANTTKAGYPRNQTGRESIYPNPRVDQTTKNSQTGIPNIHVESPVRDTDSSTRL